MSGRCAEGVDEVVNFLRAAIVCVILLCASAVVAADAPHAPRLAAGGGVVAGGYRLSGGGEESFSLFVAKENGDGLRRLGEFHGRLAGVALDGDGGVLALTADGALGRYGDDVETVAEPDSRWSMAALFWHGGAPLAIANDGGRLHAVRVGADGGWEQDETVIADVGLPARVDGGVFADGLHLMVVAPAEDLSRGAVRHLLLDAETGLWRELPPLPAGDVAAFAAAPADAPGGMFGGGDGGDAVQPGVVALRQDPVLPGRRSALSFHAWRGGRWTRAALPEGFDERLTAARGFAAAGGAWLLTGETGAFFTPAPAGDSPAAGIRVGEGAGEGGAGEGVWSRWSGVVTLAGLVVLVALYCRRSRAMSRLLPGRAPDLFSRGGALALDWFLVSLVMGGYHLANGDAHILERLLNLEDVQGIFWANIAALVAYTAFFECLFGRTPGKHLSGLRVRSARGGRASAAQALLRNLLRGLDMFPLPIGFPGVVGLVAALLGPRRQRIGDRFAGTVVLRHCPMPRRDFLLASASPRRLELLGALNLSVRTEAMDVDEFIPAGEAAQDAVCRLSQSKARAAGGHARAGEIIIAADTVVVLDGRILGKPGSHDEAKGMLASLSGRSHSVFTGVTVWDTATGQGVTECEETEVEFRILSDAEIERYVASGESMDKAGGYGVQTGFLIKQVRGSLSNVVGLPMEKLRVMLEALDS